MRVMEPVYIYMANRTTEVWRDRWNRAIADNPEFTEATVDRTKLLVERDKNRPCVVIWSMEMNVLMECTFEAALSWTKSYDPTRLTHYEGARYIAVDKTYDFSNIDLFSRMYPSLDEISNIQSGRQQSPLFSVNTVMPWEMDLEI